MSFLDDIGLIFVLYFRFIFPIIVMYLWHRRFPKKNGDTAARARVSSRAHEVTLDHDILEGLVPYLRNIKPTVPLRARSFDERCFYLRFY